MPERHGDAVFTSRVRVREMRFREVPRTRVAFSGSPDHDSTSGSDRDGLPAAVSPGVTYRDARVDYRIIARLRAKPDPRAEESWSSFGAGHVPTRRKRDRRSGFRAVRGSEFS